MMKTAMKQIKNAVSAVRKTESAKTTAKTVTPRYAMNAGSATTDIIRG